MKLNIINLFSTKDLSLSQYAIQTIHTMQLVQKGASSCGCQVCQPIRKTSNHIDFQSVILIIDEQNCQINFMQPSRVDIGACFSWVEQYVVIVHHYLLKYHIMIYTTGALILFFILKYFCPGALKIINV